MLAIFCCTIDCFRYWCLSQIYYYYYYCIYTISYKTSIIEWIGQHTDVTVIVQASIVLYTLFTYHSQNLHHLSHLHHLTDQYHLSSPSSLVSIISRLHCLYIVSRLPFCCILSEFIMVNSMMVMYGLSHVHTS